MILAFDMSQAATVSTDMSQTTRPRAKNFTAIEKSALIELLTPARVNVVENKDTHGPMVMRKMKMWAEIQTEFNATGVGNRTATELKGFWRRTKLGAQKKRTEKKKALRATGGGPSHGHLSPETERIIDIIPQEQLDAPPELQNPFDSDRPQTSATKDEYGHVQQSDLDPSDHDNSMEADFSYLRYLGTGDAEQEPELSATQATSVNIGK